MKKNYLAFLFLFFSLFLAQDITAQSMARTRSIEKNIEGLTVYPNPLSSATQSFLTIQSNLNSDKNIEFFDVLGKRLFATVLRGKQLNISQLNPGVYILKITENGISEARKLVIK
ncbi:T9SS type A sorting domain-containing protein [Tamlana crocina]